MEGHRHTFLLLRASILTPVERSGWDYAPSHPAASRQLRAGIRGEGPLPVGPCPATTSQLRGAV
eukprot:15449994-Alexandrium_andersonii.AAC.1